MGKGQGGGGRTAFRGSGGAGGGNTYDFASNVDQRTARRLATQQGRANGETTLTRVPSAATGVPDGGLPRGTQIGRPISIARQVRVVGAGNVRPSTVAAHEFRINGRVQAYSPRPYSEARRLARNDARAAGVERIDYLGARAFGGIAQGNGRFTGATGAVARRNPSGRAPR